MSERPTDPDSPGPGRPPTRVDQPPDPDRLLPHHFPAELRQRLGDLERMAERGGQAALYRGRWHDGRQVVVKVYDGRRADREWVWRHWRDGAQQGHAVELVHACTAGETDYEVTAYLPAGSLAARAGQPMVPAAAERVVAQVAEALEHFHHRLPEDPPRVLVHGDIKPANLLVAAEQPLTVCLTDFGVARALEETWQQTTGARTYPYAAPELFRGARSAAVDWWALGITMLELLRGSHPFQREDGEPLPEFRVNQLVSTGRIEPDESLPARWRTLLRGLLDPRAETRWRYPQVRDWLAGQEVPVNDRVWPDQESSEAFEFAGQRVHGARELAALIAVHWQAAAELVIGVRWPRLLAWGGAVSPELGERLAEVDTDFVVARRPVDRSVAELLTRLDPQAAPAFRGFGVDEPGLRRLAREAETGNAAAVAAVVSLRDSGALRALSRLDGHSGLDVIDERWQEWCRLARSAAETALGDFEELPARELLPAILLHAATDLRYPAALAARARATRTRRTRRVGWFRRLARAATGPDAPALQAVMVLAAARAQEPQLRAPDPGTELAQQAQRLRAEVDAAIARAGPPRGPGGRLSGPPRYRTARQHAAITGLSGLVAVGYLALVAVASLGVAAATTATQGLLTAVLLLLAGGCLAAGLRLPRSGLTEGLLGAVTGAVAGLPLAAPLGAGVGLLVGPVAGWPVFWTAWVTVIVAGTAMGAAEWSQ